MALAKPAASAPPWLFTTMPFSPSKGPPFTDEGSRRPIIFLRAGPAIRAPILARRLEVKVSRSRLRMKRATPSAVFKAMFPEKPSVTTTSTVPLAMSSPSTKPR